MADKKVHTKHSNIPSVLMTYVTRILVTIFMLLIIFAIVLLPLLQLL